MPTIVRRSRHQTGRTNKRIDKTRKALPPGVRRSASGKKYQENRRNRSDKRPSRRY